MKARPTYYQYEWAVLLLKLGGGSFLRCVGMRSTPTYVGEPECNSIMERWMRTLKEECKEKCLDLHDGTVKLTREARFSPSRPSAPRSFKRRT